MGILVNRTFVKELANGVAFTGDAGNRLDRRYVVTVQEGENSVVSPEAGVIAEKNLLETVDGRVASIFRDTPSTLILPGTFVLSDDELRELGALMSHIDQNFPIDLGDFKRQDMVLDLEFKKTATGELAVKQVRPLLYTTPAPKTPTFQLVIPPHTMACGVFDLGRTTRRELELKTTLRFVEGNIPLPTATDSFSASFFKELVVGPFQEPATAEGPGVVRISRIPLGDAKVLYRFEYEQSFTLPGGESVVVELSQVDFEAIDGEPVEPVLIANEEFLTDGMFLRSSFSEDEQFVGLFYSSCRYSILPLWDVVAEFEDGTTVELEERYRVTTDRDFGPAALTYGRVSMGGENRQIADYWDLVYSATRHNTHIEYWVILDPPMNAPGLEEPVHAIELIPFEPDDGTPLSAAYLGEDFELLKPVEVVSNNKELAAERQFLRGDLDASGAIDVSDAVGCLDYLFARGRFLPCRKAADANDDGKVNVSDAVSILLVQFGAGQDILPEPFTACGTDATEDGLDCEVFTACES